MVIKCFFSFVQLFNVRDQLQREHLVISDGKGSYMVGSWEREQVWKGWVWIGWTPGLALCFIRCLCSAEHSTAYQTVSHSALNSRLSLACQDCLAANGRFLLSFWEFYFMYVPSVPFKNLGGEWAALWIRLASRVGEGKHEWSVRWNTYFL